MVWMTILMVETCAMISPILVSSYQHTSCYNTWHRWYIEIPTSDPESRWRIGPIDISYVIFCGGLVLLFVVIIIRLALAWAADQTFKISHQIPCLIWISHPMTYRSFHLEQVTWPSPEPYSAVWRHTGQLLSFPLQIQILLKKWVWVQVESSNLEQVTQPFPGAPITILGK